MKITLNTIFLKNSVSPTASTNVPIAKRFKQQLIKFKKCLSKNSSLTVLFLDFTKFNRFLKYF